MIAQGRIVAISIETLGAELTAAVLAGATTLGPLTLTDDYDENGGDVQLPSGEIATYDSVDDVALTLHLTAGLGTGYNAEDRVNVYPSSDSTWVSVQVGDEQDDSVLAEVQAALVPRLNEGVLDTDEQQQAVIEDRGGHWLVIDVLSPPSRDIVADSVQAPLFRTGDLDDNYLEITTLDNGNRHDIYAFLDKDTPMDIPGDIAFAITGGFSDVGELYIQPPSIGGLDKPVLDMLSANTLGARSSATIQTADLAIESGRLFWLGGDAVWWRSGTKTIMLDDGTSPGSPGGGVAVTLRTRGAPPAPAAGGLIVWVGNDGSSHPQLKVKNSAGTVIDLTSFVDGA